MTLLEQPPTGATRRSRPVVAGDRRSPAYIRWAQAALNRIMGARLPLDGVFSPATRNLLRAFQGRHGLPADGVLGPRTEAALLAAGATSGPGRAAPALIVLPSPGPGYYSYQPAANQYGLPATIQAIQSIGAAWLRAHPRGPRIGVGDLSLRGGGPMPNHVAHRLGLEVDFRPLRNDGRELEVSYQSPDYARALTQQLIDAIHANALLRVEHILFSDPQIRGVRHQPKHDGHIHVRFAPPASQPNREVDAELSAKDRRRPAYIRWVQQSLNRIDRAGLTVDGIKGTLTTRAIQRFQRRVGLPPDGAVGPLTERALRNAGAPPPPGAGTTPVSPPAGPAPPGAGTTPVSPPAGPAPQPNTACLDRCWQNFERCLRFSTFPPGCMARLGSCQHTCDQ